MWDIDFGQDYRARVVASEREAAVRFAAPEGGYNGWTNHPTWHVYLYITNDESTFVFCRDALSDAVRVEMACEPELRSVFALCDALKDALSEVYGESILGEMSMGNVDLVNWPEVVFALVDGFADDFAKFGLTGEG